MSADSRSFVRRTVDSSPLVQKSLRLRDSLEAAAKNAERRLPKLPEPKTFPSWLPLATFFVAFLAICRRGWALLDRPDFYIEDGREFFQHAYNLGVESLWRVYAGYFHAFPRLGALLADLLPIRYAPLAVSLEAIALQAATAAFLVSGRLARQIPSVWARGLLAFAVVAHPNADELFGNIAHSQWYLALLVILILSAEPAKGRVQRVLEGLLLVVAAFTGPFPLVLAPFALVVAFRDRRFWFPSAVLTLGAVVTFAPIMAHPRAKAQSAAAFRSWSGWCPTR
ncbi:MAG: hypothetical protein ACO1SV_00930 [Fimbriimonas sp.]